MSDKNINNEIKQKQLVLELKYAYNELHFAEFQVNKYKDMLNRTSAEFNIRYDFPSYLITLDSRVLSPELRAIKSSMHITELNKVIKINNQTWKYKHSHNNKIAHAVGGYGLVKSVIQLPGQNANVLFRNPECREIGLSTIKRRLRQNSPAIQYSLAPFPKLKHQVKAMSVIFNYLKKNGAINNFSLNNFAACTHNDFLQPLYSFKVSPDSKPTKFEDSRSIALYTEGFTVPIEDNNFCSDEFFHLRSVIWNHVNMETDSYKRSTAKPDPSLGVRPLEARPAGDNLPGSGPAGANSSGFSPAGAKYDGDTPPSVSPIGVSPAGARYG